MALELALQKEMCCEKDTIKSRSARERTTEDERERESERAQERTAKTPSQGLSTQSSGLESNAVKTTFCNRL